MNPARRIQQHVRSEVESRLKGVIFLVCSAGKWRFIKRLLWGRRRGANEQSGFIASVLQSLVAHSKDADDFSCSHVSL